MSIPQAEALPPSPPRLILASTSPYRRALLERLGLPFDCMRPACDEDAYKRVILDPRQLAETLAWVKAESVAKLEPSAVVIGGDQVCVCDGTIHDKPGTAARAVEQLETLQGRSHRLLTAVCVVAAGRGRFHLDETTLHMRALSRQAIERYVERDSPLDCAGAYKLESRGIVLFEQIDTADHTAITGIPLLALTSILNELGFSIP